MWNQLKKNARDDIKELKRKEYIFVPINFAKAQKIYNKGETVYVAPSNMDPDNPWGETSALNKSDVGYGIKLSDRVKHWEYYHGDPELGSGRKSWYIKVPAKYEMEI